MKVCEMSSHQAFLFVPVLLTNLSFSRLSCLNVFEYLQTFGFVPVSVDFLMIDAENPQSCQNSAGTGETDRAQPGYSFPDIPPKHTHTNKHVVFQLGRTLRSLMHFI